MKTVRLTTAQALVRFLSNQYLERDGVEQRMFAGMFGIFGHGNVSGIGQALEEVGEDLTYFRPQNEQAMVHTSIAYTRMKNRLQMMACTSSVGPGALNMVTGAATATVNRLPVLLLPGDTFANRIPHPVLQQLEYPLGQDVSVNDCFRPVSRYFDRISRPEQLLSSAPEAMRVLADPAETGAVTLAFPEDTQTEDYDYPANFLEKRVHRIVRQIAPESELRYAAAMIGASMKPLIVAGGGVIYSEATDSLARFADEFGIPVVTTQAGNGSMPWNHPWYAGPVGSNGGLAANRLAAEADLVIAIGTRLSDFTTASRTAFQNDELRILSINVNAMDAHKAGSFPLVSDAWEALMGLTPMLQAQKYRTVPAYGDAVESLVGEWNHAVDEQRSGIPGVALTQGQAIGIVNDATEPTDVVVCAAGGMPGDLLKLWRPLDPKGYHVEYGFSCMGYEIAGGLGVKMADPERQVFVMVGDGSYLMMNSELVTSIAEGMKINLVVVDNSGFQCIRGLQMSCGSPSFGNELRYRDPVTNRLDGELIPIDFAANGASLGAVAYSATSPDELESALVSARSETRSTVIHVRVDKDIRVPGYDSWWDVPIAEVSSEPGVQEALEAYNEAREKQRFLY
ncbi:MAG TPA: 3D-(3,5/4)-trihydroxycyclohexane-1,2-dione acylhydrolase (decyclizing) [Thermomicrobiales bacterium]|nr:3D-(3,5/4)-trihydroxycyclohexane-1,2-dione acylhydrolase (decyclizing) [Thermomicrobiales bacterium]